MTDQCISPNENNEGQRAEKLQELAQGATSRRGFFRRSAAGAAIVTVTPAALLVACGQTSTTGNAGNTPTASSSTATKTGDALALPALSNTGMAFTEIMNDENAHVTFLHDALTKGRCYSSPETNVQGTSAIRYQQLCQPVPDIRECWRWGLSDGSTCNQDQRIPCRRRIDSDH